MTENNDFNNTENDSTNSRNKKRFTLVFDHEHDGIGRIEKDNIPIHNSEVVEMLNELSDENEQLKQNIGIILKYCRDKGKYTMDMKEMETHNILQRIVNELNGDVE